ncbi:MAG: 1-deoxy-D-xylulose-5-phosphate reductoisomerase, partial [Comamonas sp.]|nr:1-deoxy-D-xylulose-5-phosphate reductoisomerase [Comamonas sp.]
MTMQVTVLGSTGSIGTNTLDVVARHPDLYRVFALSAHSRVDLMLAQCLQFQPRYAVMTSATAATALREGLQAAG